VVIDVILFSVCMNQLTLKVMIQRIAFTKGYHPRTNFRKDENGDLLTDSHNISNR